MSRYLIWLLFAILSGTICAIIAKKKGRDAGLWFFGGMLFNLVALTTVLFVNNKIRGKTGIKTTFKKEAESKTTLEEEDDDE